MCPISMCVCVQFAQSYLTPCSPMGCSPPGSSVHGISQARILDWVVISSCRESFRPWDRTHISCVSKQIVPLSHLGSPILYQYPKTKWTKKVIVTQSCLNLCHPIDCSPPGSSVHGVLQARILEWVAIPFSRDLPDPGIEPRSPALQANSLPSEPPWH